MRFRGTLACVLALLAGCMPPAKPQPLPVPKTPALVEQAERSSDLRSTVVPGQTPVPSAPTAAATTVRPGPIALNFPGADIGIVAKSVLGDILRLPYSIAPGVTGTVNLVTPGPVARESVLPLLETALRSANLALTRSGAGYLIQPVSAAQAAGPVTPETPGFGTEIVALQFINGTELRKLIDSVLPGVVTSVDPGTNAVTIAGTTGQRRSARDLIAQFDVNWLRNMSFALFVPQRTDSRLIVPELEKLINAPDAPTRGLVRLIQMERLNGILAISAQPQYVEDVRRWVEILDREGESNEARLFVYRVQNGRARDLARTLNQAMLGGGGDEPIGAEGNATPPAESGPPPPQAMQPNGQPPTTRRPDVAPAGINSAGPVPGETIAARITADEVNNAVIVFGTPRDFAIVEDALRKLDIPPVQVMIEAAITEVSLTDDLRFGVQWNFQEGEANFALVEGGTTTPTRIVPGFSFFYAPTNNIRVTLNALEERANLKVVSAPKLLVLNNQTAALQVGDQVPISTQSAVSVQNPDSPLVNSISYRDTGVLLRVTPRVNAGGLVLLDISQEVSDVASTTSSGIDSPTIATRRVATTIAVQDGQVIAMGGLFRDSRSFGKNGLPILSRIPILGSLLFGNTRNLQRRTELILILQARVIRTIDDGQAITDEFRQKLRTLEPFRTQGRIP